MIACSLSFAKRNEKLKPRIKRVPRYTASSVTRWLVYSFKISQFTTMKMYPNSKKLAKVGSMICQKLNKPSKSLQKSIRNSQSGEFSPIVATLRLQATVKHSSVFLTQPRVEEFPFWSALITISVTRKKLPNVYKGWPKMISIEKW